MSLALGHKDPMPAAAPAGMPDDAVVVRGLNKTYRAKSGTAVQALIDIDLAIPRGSLYGLLGPNGAGKSTTVKVLTTLSRPDGGSAMVACSSLRASTNAPGRSLTDGRP